MDAKERRDNAQKRLPEKSLPHSGKRSLPPLPVTCLVGPSSMSLVVDRMDPGQTYNAYRLVCGEAERGEDFGVDEFPTPETFQELVEFSDSFSLTDQNGTFRGVIALAPSSYCRSEHPPYADGVLVCDPELKENLYEYLVKLALQFVAWLGYEGCLADMFSSSVHSVDKMKKAGFGVIGCVPNSGLLTGKGWTDNLILYSDLTAAVPTGDIQILEEFSQKVRIEAKYVSEEQPKATKDKDDSLTESSSSTSADDVPAFPLHQLSSTVDQPMGTGSESAVVSRILIRQQHRKPNLGYLPCSYRTISGRAVTLRYLEEAELPEAFCLYEKAANLGDGIAAEEFPNVDVFKQFYYEYGHAIVAVDESKIILCLSVTPSMYCRSFDPTAADLYAIVDQTYRGEGLGVECARLCLRFARDLGYHAIVTDVFMANRTAWKILLSSGFSPVGYIPRAAYLQGSGWDDCVVLYKDLVGDQLHLAKL